MDAVIAWLADYPLVVMLVLALISWVVGWRASRWERWPAGSPSCWSTGRRPGPGAAPRDGGRTAAG
ncbi:MAG TPA: hypothetical protein VGX49_15930 [Jatrophihabitans sp.]|jgi:hypothetical protein|nr:hypothetical protein [Jatrophihabitans sp.]